jgi:hypothetical protein
MKRAHIYILAGLLAGLACGVFLYKVLVLGFPLRAEEHADVWRVEVQVRFVAEGGPAKVGLYVPVNTSPYVVSDQSFVSPGYGITTERDPGHGMRAIYSIRGAQGAQTLYYQVVVHRARGAGYVEHDPRPELSPPRRVGAEEAAAQSIVRSALQQSADPATLVGLIVKRLKEAKPGDEASFLLKPPPGSLRLMRTAVGLIQSAGVPARLVNGIMLAPERRNAQFVHWIEFYADGRWRSYSPAESAAQPPAHYLPWWRGPGDFVEVNGGGGVEYSMTTSRSHAHAIDIALSQRHELERRLVDFSLFGLPLQARALFRSLLVIPIGILLLVVLRNIVGVKTFGTFMPVLIALAFRQTGLAWGIGFFCIVVGIGLTVRFYLDQLKLLLVPRLAAVVIVVVLTLALLTVLSYRLGFERGLWVGLFPIVILTMTIERMTLVWEERGAGEALQQAAGSILVGVLCYFAMNQPVVVHLFFTFPELLLVVLAITLLLGRYSGYRLTELWRFRTLAK